MNINETKLEKVTIESKTKLENLMSLYLHDLSEFAYDLKINENGRFEYDGFDLYFKSDELTPYFIIYNDEVVGFVLFNTGKYVPKDIDYAIHELFILKWFRSKGVASAAVKILLDGYKGKYRVEQIAANNTAVKFWTRFYESEGIKYKESREEYEDLVCKVQIFNV